MEEKKNNKWKEFAIGIVIGIVLYKLINDFVLPML